MRLVAWNCNGAFHRKSAALAALAPDVAVLSNHIRWDKPGKSSNHANAVAALDGLGMVSAYHAFLGLAPGAERHPTLYWRDRTEAGPTYHIDYAFVPKSSLVALRSVAVGSYADWIGAGLSDHAPLILEFNPGFTREGASVSAAEDQRGKAGDLRPVVGDNLMARIGGD